MKKARYDPSTMMLLKIALNRSIKVAGVFAPSDSGAVNPDRRAQRGYFASRRLARFCAMALNTALSWLAFCTS